MKKIIILVVTFCTTITGFCQTQPHQPAPPPSNAGANFIRSLSVDCTDLIIDDIVNGNAYGLGADLINYITDNYISYVILRDLENANVFGDQLKESALRQLLDDIRSIDPDIQVGICGSSSAFFQTTPFLNDASSYDKNCYGTTIITNYDQLNRAINNPIGNYSDNTRSAIITFFLNASRFMDSELLSNRKKCRTAFDAFYVDYPYWNTTTSMQAMQNDFENFKDILSVLMVLKCNSPCIRFIDAEFLPTDLYKLQGWTAIDQITEADTLIDRIIMPAYTNNASGTFDLRCKLMHFLSDQFSKTGTKFFVKVSAESTAFNYCNSVSTPGNFLGDYLNGTTIPSGNLYSVEKIFLDYYNSITYVCPACNCSTYTDNHYSSANIRGNILAGSMWTPYSMLQAHQLFRKSSIPLSEFPDKDPVEVRDITGRMIGIFKNEREVDEAMRQYPAGVYLIIGKTGSRKRVN